MDDKTMIGRIPLEYWNNDEDIRKYKKFYAWGYKHLANYMLVRFLKKHKECQTEDFKRFHGGD